MKIMGIKKLYFDCYIENKQMIELVRKIGG